MTCIGSTLPGAAAALVPLCDPAAINAWDVVVVFSGNELLAPLGAARKSSDVRFRNTGPLYRVRNKATCVGAGYLHVDDGWNREGGTLTGSEENVGVRVVCDAVAYGPGDLAKITGISCCFEASPGQIARRILTRRAWDVGKISGP